MRRMLISLKSWVKTAKAIDLMCEFGGLGIEKIIHSFSFDWGESEWQIIAKIGWNGLMTLKTYIMKFL